MHSPEVADAFGIQSLIAYQWSPIDRNGFADIARRHGWDYSGDDQDGRDGPTVAAEQATLESMGISGW